MSLRGAIEGVEFARLMARCAPFEPRPLLAVAVSGGADSMALALVADEWARARKGSVVALTVDHRLRSESRAEARQVGRWMKVRGIAHRVIAWRGPKRKTGIQAAARAARYRLLAEWCRDEGVLHLLLGHTRDDQAETVLLRLAAGSGPHGLAAMPAVQEIATVRILRPLLDVARERLRYALRARDQSWIEDPSNRDERFARIRVRRLLAAARGADTHAAAIANAASELGRFRAGRERKIAETLARAAEIDPAGYARIDAAALATAAPEIGWRALAALLATIGGLDYPPRSDAVRDLHADLCAGRLGRGRTLAGCRLLRDGNALLVVRETRGLENLEASAAGKRFAAWDGRFELTPSAPGRVAIAGLGEAGWAEIVAHEPGLRATGIPYAARLALPALRAGRGRILEVPALSYRQGRSRKKAAFAAFRPSRPLAPAIFAAADTT